MSETLHVSYEQPGNGVIFALASAHGCSSAGAARDPPAVLATRRLHLVPLQHVAPQPGMLRGQGVQGLLQRQALLHVLQGDPVVLVSISRSRSRSRSRSSSSSSSSSRKSSSSSSGST